MAPLALLEMSELWFSRFNSAPSFHPCYEGQAVNERVTESLTVCRPR